MMNVLLDVPKRTGQILIIIYQRTLSPDHGPMAKILPWRTCGYHPTCSEYSYQALDKYGLVKGSWLTAKRLARCVPWKPGGHDPVP